MALVYTIARLKRLPMKSLPLEILRLIINSILEILFKLGKFQWIVASDHNVGFRIFGINVTYYKWHDTAIIQFGIPYPGEECYKWRSTFKRELSGITTYHKE